MVASRCLLLGLLLSYMTTAVFSHVWIRNRSKYEISFFVIAEIWRTRELRRKIGSTSKKTSEDFPLMEGEPLHV
ncbi:hypothetical protein ATANTOWER_014674 [Ataeniobius toweri]|uniref:Secreted protein n=1 Tax=Ataeniobius toweri TaxID=208326 RepID=A0ABU7A6E9_9TELE|nr:hypothetical protein [Ataeniobius toweri]